MRVPARSLRPLTLAAGVLAAVLFLGGCASRPALPDRPSAGGPSQGGYVMTGSVRSIQRLDARNNTTGAGALIGSAVGAVVGRQFGGSSDGRAQGTWAGAIGGALLGNEIEKDRGGARGSVRINVEFDGGGERSFDYASAGDLRVGDRVRVEGNRLYR